MKPELSVAIDYEHTSVQVFKRIVPPHAQTRPKQQQDACPPRSCVRPQHRHTPVNSHCSGASRRTGQSYGLVHPPLQSVSTRRGTLRCELINHLSSRRTKARSAVNGANAIMNGIFNSWPSQTYLPAGVLECPQQCSAWDLRNKHPSQTCSCVPDRA